MNAKQGCSMRDTTHWKQVTCLLWVYWGIVLFFVIFPSGAIEANSARGLTEEGNALYRAGKYDEALQAYEQAEREQPDSPEILFNKGNATLQKGDTAKAREAYEAAAIQAKNPALEAKCQFNLGHVDFIEGEKKVPASPREALPLYERSIRHFQNALRADPSLVEAGENIEIARIKLKELMDRIQEQEEEAAGKQQEQQETPKQRQETGAEQGDQQEENDSRQEQKAGNPEESGPRGKDEQKDDGSSPPPQAQDREKKDSRGKPSPASASQQPPEGKNQPGRQQKDPASAKESMGEGREDTLVDEKARQAIQEQAQDILQEEKENRLLLQRSRPGGAQPVDKDW